MVKKLVKIISGVTVLAIALAIIFFNRYSIYDWERLHNYHAPQNIALLADQTTMTSKAREIFYATYPQIQGKTEFNSNCQVKEQTIVLGCYTSGSIFLFNVDTPELNGVEQVTAAHEMLHAAYARLSSSEKKRIDVLLEEAFKKINNPELNQTMASYQKTEPAEQDNELHSILATEHENLGTDLETYYRQYFANRAQVVAYANQYKEVFINIKNQVANDDAQLAIQKTKIVNLENSLNTQYTNLQAEKDTLQAGPRTLSVSSFNTEVSNYNNLVDQYNAQVATLQAYITAYNALVTQRNALAVQQQGLANSLNSNAPTATPS